MTNFFHPGTIGLIGVKSPPFFTHGRMLHRQSQKVQSAPFAVDKKKRKVYIDFGNSLPTTKNGSFNTKNLQKLYVGMSVDVGASSRISCGSKFFWLGKVEQTSPTWYRNNAGIQCFPLNGSFSTQEFDMIKDSPLALVEVRKCFHYRPYYFIVTSRYFPLYRPLNKHFYYMSNKAI